MAKQQALVAKRVEWLPIEHPQNKMYTDRLLWVLDKRIRKDPVFFVLYKGNNVVGMGQSEQGVGRLKSQAMENKKKRMWDRFALYTLKNRAFLNDIDALASRMVMRQGMSMRNFAKAKNTTEEVKKDIRSWANAEIRTINRSLAPMERKLKRAVTQIEKKEHKLRKRYLKRIEKARDSARQKALRMERDKKIMQMNMQRKKLEPWRRSIAQWQAKMRSFQAIKL